MEIEGERVYLIKCSLREPLEENGVDLDVNDGKSE
jgi:hypothetical protein